MRQLQLLGGASAIALMLGASQALAQQAPASPDGATGAETPGEARPDAEIIVTARKRAEDIQKVPAVVSAVSGDQIDDLGGLSNTRDLTALVPGVTMIESANGPTAEPNIRGAGQARLPNSDPAIGLYRDGAYIVGGNLGGRSFQRFDLFDADRIEVLRGPQGALYGRNAVGGAINVISRKPDFTKFSGEISGIIGSQHTLGTQGIVNVPISSTFALRGGWDIENQQGGFYYNTYTNKVQDPASYGAGRLSARWKPSTALDINLVGDYAKGFGDIGETVDLPDLDNDPYAVQYNTSQRTGFEQYSLGLSVNWNLGNTQIVSTTGYRHRNSYANIDDDGTATASDTDHYDDYARMLYQELRAQGSAGRLNWLVGADLFYLRDTYNIEQLGRALIVTPAMGMNPATSVDPNFTSDTSFNQKSYALYGSLEWSITDAFKLEGEGRYSIDGKKAVIDAQREDGSPRYVDFPPGSPATMPHDTFHNFSYGVTASYQISPRVLAFGRVATAYRAGGFNSDLGNPCQAGETPGTNCNLIDVPASYGEEHTIDYEVGLKTSWLDRHLLLNANVYRTNTDDILANLNNGVMAMADPLDSAMFLANAGDAHQWGAEIEMSSRFDLPQDFGNVQFNGSVSHQHGEFVSVNPAITTVLVGNGLARLRPWAFNSNVIWRVPVTRKLSFVTSFTYLYEDGGFLSAENDFTLDHTRRGNARVALDGRNWEAAILVQNVFNDRYFVNQSGTAVDGIGTSFRYNDPRSFQVSLKLKW